MTPPPSEPPPHLPVAGWYPDPHAGQLRYWDGQRWTEHLTPYPEGDPGAPPPPQAGDAVIAESTTPGTAVDRLPPLGQWISETTRLVVDQAGHLFTLIVVLTFAIDLGAALLTWVAAQDVVITIADDNTMSVEGAGAPIVFAILASVLSTAAKIVLAACAARHVLAARTGVPESWSDTLREAGARLPRVVGALAIFIGAFVVLYLVVVIPFGLVAALLPFLGIFALVGVFAGLLAGLARIGFGPVMSLIAPVGDGGIRRSIALTKGATVSVCKRLSMLAMIGFTMWLIARLFTAPLLGDGGGLAVTDNTIDFADVVGENIAAFTLGQIITGLVAGAFAALVGGGLGLLYADLGGPIEPSITHVDPTGVPSLGAS